MRVHVRFYAALAAGLAAGLAAWPLALTDRILIGADLFSIIYLISTVWWIRGRSGDDLREHFAGADEGGALIVLLALGAVGVSLYAIAHAVLLPGDPLAHALRPVLALGAVPLGWAVVHAVMAFHYARLFYTRGPDGRDLGGLDFPGDMPEPGPWEFLYYSFTLGMTAQTSDVGLTRTALRRVTLFHSVLSFFYNAVIVALAVSAGTALGPQG